MQLYKKEGVFYRKWMPAEANKSPIDILVPVVMDCMYKLPPCPSISK